MKGFITKTGGKKTVPVPVMAPRPQKQSGELCGTCGHEWYYHLFNGKVCGYSETKCMCTQFVHTGRYRDFSLGAERTKEPPHITDTTEAEKPSAEQLRTLARGVPLFHTRRGACTFVGMDEADPSGLTVWVNLEGDEIMVSSGFLKWAPKPASTKGKHTKERRSCSECKRYIGAAGTGHSPKCTSSVPKSKATCGCGAKFEDTATVGAVEQLARHAAEAH